MDPRLKVVVILLVGAAIGAVVAGGALSYVSGPPVVPVQRVSSEWSTSSPPPTDGEVPAMERSDRAPGAPLPHITRQEGELRMYGTDGPDATVSTEPGSAPPPSKPQPVTKKVTPVVEEEAEPKGSEDGSVREPESGNDGDGGSIR